MHAHKLSSGKGQYKRSFAQMAFCRRLYVCIYIAQKDTILQVTTMLATSKNALLTTGTDAPSLG